MALVARMFRCGVVREWMGWLEVQMDHRRSTCDWRKHHRSTVATNISRKNLNAYLYKYQFVCLSAINIDVSSIKMRK